MKQNTQQNRKEALNTHYVFCCEWLILQLLFTHSFKYLEFWIELIIPSPTSCVLLLALPTSFNNFFHNGTRKTALLTITELKLIKLF